MAQRLLGLGRPRRPDWLARTLGRAPRSSQGSQLAGGLDRRRVDHECGHVVDVFARGRRGCSQRGERSRVTGVFFVFCFFEAAALIHTLTPSPPVENSVHPDLARRLGRVLRRFLVLRTPPRTAYDFGPAHEHLALVQGEVRSRATDRSAWVERVRFVHVLLFAYVSGAARARSGLCFLVGGGWSCLTHDIPFFTNRTICF